MTICREVIDQLGKDQESRLLNDGERNMLAVVKSRLIGLTAIEKSIARQRSRLTWLRKGDANTIFSTVGQC
jgi:hypothetical protein